MILSSVMKKKFNEDKILLRHIFFTFLGWFLFITINLIQFFIFMPIIFIISFIFDKNRILFPYMTKFFSNMFFFLYFVEKLNYQKNGIKPPKKGEKRIYVINHASQYDVILMYLLPGPIKFIFKDKWAKKPIVGWMAYLAKNLIVRDDMTAAELANLFKKAGKQLEAGIPFIIFPEGTRSRDGKIGEFFHGTFKLAIDNQADIVPVVFDSWNCIRPGALWIRDTKAAIRVLDPIKYENYKDLNFGKVSFITRRKMIQALVDLRDERRAKEKNYYRKIDKFMKIDDEMRTELIEMDDRAAKKGIYLLNESPTRLQ